MALLLKLKTKSGQLILKELRNDNTVSDLKKILSEKCEISPNFLNVLSGFPPKPLNLENEEISLESLGMRSGDTLIVEAKVKSTEAGAKIAEAGPKVAEAGPKVAKAGPRAVIGGDEASQPITTPKHAYEEQLGCPGVLLRKVVPADNSCLFTSVGFTLSGKVDTNCGAYMRKLIVEHVSQDPITYSEAILGKTTKEYCDWILKPDSWGGAIELSVLSRYYGIEMDVVDTLNAIINRFGEDQDYAQRVFLIFDGIHYDPLYLEPLDEAGEIKTLFPMTDEQVLRDAEQLAIEAKSSRQYTDVNKFSLKCLDCQIIMQGQVEAQEHAKSSGHLNFGEV